jgi:hypothetical protein
MLNTDTPVRLDTFPRPSRMDQIKALIGDLARPFALIALGGSCAVGLHNGSVTADKLGLALAALGAMYGAKSWEASTAAKATATIEVAKAAATPAPANDAQALPVPDSERPPWERTA